MKTSKPSWQLALERIHDAGFPFLKVEFEGQLNRSGEWYDPSFCDAWILNQVPTAAAKAVRHLHFYRDGSVDTEVTITLPTKKAQYFVDFAKAFAKLGEEVGHLDTRGAGMHIATLLEGSYPSGRELEHAKYTNFRNQMNKLMPALFFLGSPDSRSRALGFRHPGVDGNGKYSAISSRSQRVFEFRVFETCYQRPEMLLDNFEIIANCLRYYADPNLKVEVPYKGAYFFPEGNRQLSRFYDEPEKLRLLNTGLALLKPADKSMTQIKRERAFKLSEASLQLKANQLRAKSEQDYNELVQRWEHEAKRIKSNFITAFYGQMEQPIYEQYLVTEGYLPKKPDSLEAYIEETKARRRSGVTMNIN